MEKDHDQFSDLFSGSMFEVSVEGNNDNHSWHLYLDSHQHFQVSIVRLSINHTKSPSHWNICIQESPIKGNDRGVFIKYGFPSLCLHEVAVIENVLTDKHQIDGKQCLLDIYNSILLYSTPHIHSTTRTVLISPMTRGNAKAARLTFDSERSFTWLGWNMASDRPNGVEMSCVSIGKISWTRYVEPAIIDVVIDCLKALQYPIIFLPIAT